MKTVAFILLDLLIVVLSGANGTPAETCRDDLTAVAYCQQTTPQPAGQPASAPKAKARASASRDAEADPDAASCALAKADDDVALLQGVWDAQAMESNGKPAAPEKVKRVRFTFKEDMLHIAGNFDDDREMECAYKVDSKHSPKHFEFTPPDQTKAVLGIYSLKPGELKICMRHARSSSVRPTEFKAEAGSKLILIVFKKRQPQP